MAVIKSHLCKSCGGLLDIDLDRQLYICPFCGISYDYEYFREDNVLDIANRALNRGEFGSAKEAYEFALKKDPHNFEALRGILLCNCKWKSMSPIVHSENVQLKETDPVLLMVLEKSPQENREFFENIKDSLNILYEYRRNRAEIKRLANERDICSKRLNSLYTAKRINEERFTSSIHNIYNDLGEEKLASFFIYMLILVLIGIAYATWAAGIWILASIVGIVVLIAVVYNINKAITNKSLDAAITPVKEQVDKYNNECENIRIQNGNLMNQYNDLTKKILAVDMKYNKASSPAGNPDDDDLSESEDTSAED
jgi:hypothetical protein